MAQNISEIKNKGVLKVELSKMKKIISGTVSAVMIAASFPLSSSAADVKIDLGSVTGSNVGGGWGGNGGMTWGGNGGGMDWSGFAGGFDNAGANIGADAGSQGNDHDYNDFGRQLGFRKAQQQDQERYAHNCTERRREEQSVQGREEVVYV